MRAFLPFILAIALAAAAAAQAPITVSPLPGAAPPTGSVVLQPRVRDVTRLHNVMPHQLVGIGVVTGLSGTGSSDRGTRQAILNLVRDHNLNLTPAEIGSGNAAIVTLTATLPPFAKEGQAITVKVQSYTDATSLFGGELLRAELRGVDNQTYVVAQGKVWTSGFAVKGTNASVEKNRSTVGEVKSGLVVRDLESSFFSESGDLELQVSNPSPFNAASIAAGVREALGGTDYRAFAVDPTLVRIVLPPAARTQSNAVDILTRIGEVRVAVENPSKIIVDQASGTVIAGEGVMISPCVIGVGELTVSIVNEDEIVQPNPFAGGDTARVSRTRIEVTRENSELRALQGGATVHELLQNLKQLGLTPPQLVNVFVALGPYLHAELEVR